WRTRTNVVTPGENRSARSPSRPLASHVASVAEASGPRNHRAYGSSRMRCAGRRRWSVARSRQTTSAVWLGRPLTTAVSHLDGQRELPALREEPSVAAPDLPVLF